MCRLRTIPLLAAMAVSLSGGLNAADLVYETGPAIVHTGEYATASDHLDGLVFSHLRKLNLKPANLCSDAVFLRRAYLCAIGTLPTEEEARLFLEQTDPDRRSRLVDDLLKRDEFADYWSMKWSDLLRVKAEFPIKLWPNAAQAYHRWIYASVRDNKPFHQFVRELLVANGSNFREGEVKQAFQELFQSLAEDCRLPGYSLFSTRGNGNGSAESWSSRLKSSRALEWQPAPELSTP